MLLIRSLALIITATFGLTSAHAARSHHEQVKVTAIKRGGKVIGAKVDMVLMNDDGYEEMRASLVQPATTSSLQRQDSFDKSKAVVASPIKSVKGKTADRLTMQIIYGQGNNLRGGEHLDVVSGWRRAGASVSAHVWGAVTGANRPVGHQGDIQLPASPDLK